MKIKLIILLISFNIITCLVIPEKYLNKETFNNIKINYSINLKETNLKELSDYYYSCANIFEKSDPHFSNAQLIYKINRLDKIKYLVKSRFEKFKNKESVADNIYNISIIEIFCNNNYLNIEREDNNASNNLLAYFLLGIIPSVVTYDTYYLISISNEKFDPISEFVVIQDQKSIFSIFSAPFSLLFELSEKIQNKIIESISEKIILEIYFKLEK